MKKTEFQRYESIFAKLDHKMAKRQEKKDKKNDGSKKKK